MKIAGYSLSLQSRHDRSQQTSVKEELRAWTDPPAARASPAARVAISSAAKARLASDAAAVDDAPHGASNDPRMQLLALIIEKLTGQSVTVFDASQLQAGTGVVAAGAPAAAQQPAQPAPGRLGYGLDYTRTTSYSESEQTTFAATGVIKTSDGKEIKFNLDLSMRRQYSETSSTRIQIGDAARKTDPLVINFAGTAAQLSDQRFAFDLNSDGQAEQISAPGQGSGFLALDRNSDGKVNNGSELFGPGTGNGFGELAKYDGDSNGWIDGNDAVFGQLRVWTKDAAGHDTLSSLAALGVGAISLNAIDTPFDIKTQTNALLGSVRSSSVVLNENGSAGTAQQIDLTA